MRAQTVVNELYRVLVPPRGGRLVLTYVQAAIMTEISAFGRSSREYYRDKWNWLDIPALFLLATGFVVRLADALGPDDHTDNVGEALYLLSAPLLFARVLFFAQIHPAQGAMIEVRTGWLLTLKHVLPLP